MLPISRIKAIPTQTGEVVELERESFVLVILIHVDQLAIGAEHRVAIVHSAPEGPWIKPALEITPTSM